MAAGTAPRRALRRARSPVTRSRSSAADAHDPGAVTPAPRPRPADRRPRSRQRADASARAKRPRKPATRRPEADPGMGQAPANGPPGARRRSSLMSCRRLRPAGLGAPPRPDQRADPDDPHPEHRRHERRGGVRGAARGLSRRASRRGASAGRGLGRRRPDAEGAPPDWAAVEFAPLPELIDVIRPGGLARRRRRASRRPCGTIREARGDHSLEFLGDMPAIEARDWLTRIDGIGKKTASVLLLFCFGTPLMPVDRHVERVSIESASCQPRRPPTTAHDLYLALLEPDQVYEAHVQPHPPRPGDLPRPRPACELCPLRTAADSSTKRRPRPRSLARYLRTTGDPDRNAARVVKERHDRVRNPASEGVLSSDRSNYLPPESPIDRLAAR